MPRVVVVHYDLREAAILAERVRRGGFEADVYTERGTAGFRGLRQNPPDAIVLDLMRMPSYGRMLGVLLRQQKSTRTIPLVFLKGDPEKVKLVRQQLPDAIFADLPRVAAAIQKAIAHKPAEPVLPSHSRLAVTGKLRIREGSVVALLHAPSGFAEKLGRLPEGVRFQTHCRDAQVVLSFVKSAAALGREMQTLGEAVRSGALVWLLWPKKASAVESDLTMPRIFDMCAAADLAAHRVCSVDETWSGLAIALRRPRRRTAAR